MTLKFGFGVATFFWSILFSVALQAQIRKTYQPCETYSAESKELIENLKGLMTAELQEALAVTKEKEFIRSVYQQRTNYIVDLVKRRLFIHNDSLETFVNTVLLKLTGREDRQGNIVLIARAQEVNAFCYARGIFVVTVGLLARISTEAELAFTLAHELSHAELDHVKSSILVESELKLAKKSKEQLKQLFSGKLDLAQLEEFRQLVYGVRRHSRTKELQADSLGLNIFVNADYSESDALSMLNILESWSEPKYRLGADLLKPLDSDDFPLQDDFFNEQLSLYKRKPSGNFLFSTDSLQSHPEMKLRKQMLQQYFTGYSANAFGQLEPFVKNVNTIAEFETVEAAFVNIDFDWCIYHALHLLASHPDNSYLISRIGAVLVKLYEVKDEFPERFNFYVSRFTGNYSVEARAINNLLHNLTTREIGEMAFFFLENENHFDAKNRSHYYLLWKASEITNRKDVAKKMKDSYKVRFGDNLSAFKW